MAWTNAKTAIVIGVVALLAAGTATMAHHPGKKPSAEKSSSDYPGYATPENAVHTIVLAMSRGDMESYFDILAPEAQDYAKNTHLERWKENMIGAGNAIMNFQITQKEVISDTEIHLHIRTDSGDSTIPMLKVGNQWKANFKPPGAGN